MGSRVAADDITICAPRAKDAVTYFSEHLTNSGGDPVQIVGVSGVDLEQASVEFFVDVDGPDLGQFLGSFVWPTQDPIGPEEQVLLRMQAPEGATVLPGVTAALYVKVTPTSATDDAVVREIEVKYRSGSRDYRELVYLQFKVPTTSVC